jgi:hypothetical protein
VKPPKLSCPTRHDLESLVRDRLDVLHFNSFLTHRWLIQSSCRLAVVVISLSEDTAAAARLDPVAWDGGGR